MGPARQNLQTAARPSSNTQNASQNVSPAGLGIGGKPQGKAAPIMASSTMSSTLSLSSTAPTSMRQILPKDKARVGQSPSIARPTQVTDQFLSLNHTLLPDLEVCHLKFLFLQIVGPIAASSSTVPPPTPQSLVAAVLPTQIQTNKKQTSGQQLGAENNKQMNHHLHSTSKQTNKLADEQAVPRLYSMSTSEKAIAEANAVSSKKQAQAFSMPTSKQAHAQLHSTGKQMQAQVHITPTSKQTPVQLYSTPTSKHVPAQLYTTSTSKQANVKAHSTSTSTNQPLIEPLPSVTISTKSSSQTLREFRKGRPSSNPGASEPQKVVTALEAIQQRHGPAMQKVSCPTNSPFSSFFSRCLFRS